MRKRKTYRIADAFENVHQSAWVPAYNDIVVELTYTTDGIDMNNSSTKQYTIIGEKDLWNFILQHWEWSYFETPTGDDAMKSFWETWDNWRRYMRDEIERMAFAWFNPYDPLSNYNSFEHSKTDRLYDSLTEDHVFGTETRTYGKITETKGGAEDTTQFGELKMTKAPASYTRTSYSDTENGQKVTLNSDGKNASVGQGQQVTDSTSVSTYDDAEKSVEKVTRAGDVASVSRERMDYDTQQDNEVTQQHTDTYNYGDRENTTEHEDDTITRMPETIITDGGYSDEAKLVRYGNIGVTTSQQMLESEIQMRLNGLKTRLLDNFLSTWFALFDGGDCDGY